MIIPKYSTHLTLCWPDSSTFTLSDGHLLISVLIVTHKPDNSYGMLIFIYNILERFLCFLNRFQLMKLRNDWFLGYTKFVLSLLHDIMLDIWHEKVWWELWLDLVPGKTGQWSECEYLIWIWLYCGLGVTSWSDDYVNNGLSDHITHLGFDQAKCI